LVAFSALSLKVAVFDASYQPRFSSSRLMESQNCEPGLTRRLTFAEQGVLLEWSSCWRPTSVVVGLLYWFPVIRH